MDLKIITHPPLSRIQTLPENPKWLSLKSKQPITVGELLKKPK
jgi:hypothetical protein